MKILLVKYARNKDRSYGHTIQFMQTIAIKDSGNEFEFSMYNN